MLMIAVAGVGAAIGLALFAVLSQAEEKAVVRASLRQLDDYEVESVREKELLVPLRERAVAPVLAGLTGLGKRFTPQGYVDEVRRKLVSAGTGDQESLDRFLAVRVITVALAPVAMYFAFSYAPVGGIAKLALVGVVGAGFV
ncbi:MAG: hypothetical protein ACT4OV_02390, partial [Microthrixaceae bacterium]